MHLPSARLFRILAAVLIALAMSSVGWTPVDAQSWLSKLDPLLQASYPFPSAGRSRVVLRATSAGAVSSVTQLINLNGGNILRQLPIIDGLAVDLPNVALPTIASSSLVARISMDRVTAGANERTGATVGAAAVRQQLGYDGDGVGIAVIDSGVAPSHDDLGSTSGQRVDQFVDFVNSQTTAYDDYGHGSHVAGIVAGNGYDSGGARTGIAPAARLIVLKVLDDEGRGRISDVIAALDYAVSHKTSLNIRIVNLSVATGVYESYNSDPLTLAAKSAVSAGIVVVAAAGNNGRSSSGSTQYAGVTAPGNAPWVLTVGASSHMGTTDRSDDTIAAFSSRGPGAIDYGAKPDIVAPGVGIESLSNPGSELYTSHSQYLLNGTVSTSYPPYLSLSGTSMSAPVVTGTVALMLEANPSLTPNQIKAILQYTAQVDPDYDTLTQGAGFLNAKGAVELAAYLAAPETTAYPSTVDWSLHIVWGNHIVSGGTLTSNANAWATNVTWGAATTPGGQTIVWGVIDSQPWQAANLTQLPNAVWGPMCEGANCTVPWDAHDVGAADDEGETVVWGTSEEGETVVWGTGEEGETVVWGTRCTDSSCQPVIWNQQ
jgi:serine protease AprX